MGPPGGEKLYLSAPGAKKIAIVCPRGPKQMFCPGGGHCYFFWGAGEEYRKLSDSGGGGGGGVVSSRIILVRSRTTPHRDHLSAGTLVRIPTGRDADNFVATGNAVTTGQ